MSNHFWLTGAQMVRLKPFSPKAQGKPHVDDRRVALLHKSRPDYSSPFPGRIYPTATLAGMPSAVYPLSTAIRTCNSATWRSK